LGLILGIAMLPLRAQPCFSPLESCPTDCPDTIIIQFGGNTRVSDLGIEVFSGSWRILDTLTVDIDTFTLNGAQLGMLTGSIMMYGNG